MLIDRSCGVQAHDASRVRLACPPCGIRGAVSRRGPLGRSRVCDWQFLDQQEIRLDPIHAGAAQVMYLDVEPRLELGRREPRYQLLDQFYFPSDSWRITNGPGSIRLLGTPDQKKHADVAETRE
jgi:hypothetical protein